MNCKNKNLAAPLQDPSMIPMPQLDREAGRKLTDLQEVAVRSGGVITPANLITIAGVGLTALGCREFVRGDKRLAVGAIAAGALCDALDGQVARRTRTANYQVGRYLDIGADGIKSAMLAKSLCDSGVYSAPELLANYGPKIAGWATNGVSKFVVGNDPKTSQTGRVAEVSRWVAPGLAVASSMLNDGGLERAASVANRAGRVATVASCVLGLAAAAGYVKGLISSGNKK